MSLQISNETDTVIKKIVPYLQRRGYDLEKDIDFEAPTERVERLAKGYVDLLINVPGAKPAFLIEAKRSGKKLSERDKNQALSYGHSYKVPFVVVTNGQDVRCYNRNTGELIQWDGRVSDKIPTKEQLKQVLNHFKKNKDSTVVPLGTDYSMPYRPGLSPKQLNALFYRSHSDIRRIEKTEERAFQDFSKLLFLKLLEEKYDAEGKDLDDLYSYRFHELAELPEAKADRVRDAIRIMLDKLVEKGYGDVLLEPITIKNPKTYHIIVSRLAGISFMDSSFDSKGAAFEYYVRATLKGKKLGQYFTPRAVIHLMSVLIGREKVARSVMSGNDVRVLDPACGTGGFLVYLMKEACGLIESFFQDNYITSDTRDALLAKLRKLTFFGADANDSVASAAKMNMIIAGDGHSNIKSEDSLSRRSTVWNVNKPDADIIITNPPFGTSEGDSLDADDGKQFPIITSKGQLLFLQKMLRCAKPGTGEICTVIDEGVLNTDSAADLRRWIAKNCRIIAVARLPEVTFKPNKINVRSSVLYLRRLKEEDVDQEQSHNVTFIDVKNIGYMGSGDPIRGFDEAKLMNEIDGYLKNPTTSGKPKSPYWSAFQIGMHDIFCDEKCRFDLKYWEPTVRSAINSMRKKGRPTLGSLAISEVRRGKSPPAECYVDEKDGYALVVKAGTNITKFGDLKEVGDYIEKIVYEEMSDHWLEDGDILLASTGTGTLGKCCVFRSKKPAVADGHVTVIRLPKDKVYPEYVCDYLRLGFGAIQVQRLYTGATGLIELAPEQVRGIFLDIDADLNVQKTISESLRAIERNYLHAVDQAELEFEKARREFFKDAPLGPSLLQFQNVEADLEVDQVD